MQGDQYGHVRQHLMPGAILPVQYNLTDDRKYKVRANSTDDLQYTDIHLIINPDKDRFAKGKLFLDGGMDISEITDKKYVHYEFEMSGFQLIKNDLNPEGDKSKNTTGVDSIILTNI